MRAVVIIFEAVVALGVLFGIGLIVALTFRWRR